MVLETIYNNTTLKKIMPALGMFGVRHERGRYFEWCEVYETRH